MNDDDKRTYKRRKVPRGKQRKADNIIRLGSGTLIVNGKHAGKVWGVELHLHPQDTAAAQQYIDLLPVFTFEGVL